MIIAMLAFLGLCLGSFVNAFVWRLHAKKDWVKGRSICVRCKHELAAHDLIPVLSWLMLKGKCRYCHKPISVQYPAVELITAALFVVSYISWPLDFNAKGIILLAFWLIFLVAFMALAVYDLRWYLLPDKVVFPFVGLAVIQDVILIVLNPSLKFVGNLALSVFIAGGIFYLIFQISKGKWIGGGDVKLGLLLGLILADAGLATLTLFTASLLGCLVALPLMATGKATRSTRLPFGPFLIAATIVARLFGAAIIHWYKRKLLLAY